MLQHKHILRHYSTYFHLPQENELLSLAKSVGGDKCEVSSLTSQLEELTQRTQQEQEEHEKLLKETQGNKKYSVLVLVVYKSIRTLKFIY